MAMGWIDPWVGWVGSKIFIITVGRVGLGQGLCSMHIQRFSVWTVKCDEHRWLCQCI